MAAQASIVSNVGHVVAGLSLKPEFDRQGRFPLPFLASKRGGQRPKHKGPHKTWVVDDRHLGEV